VKRLIAIVATIAFVLVFVVGAMLMSVESVGADIPTPTAPGAATIYTVTNANTMGLLVNHTHTQDSGVVVLVFSDTVPAGTTIQYRVIDMPAIPSPYVGSLLLEADQPFLAEVVGYTYPPTATPTIIVTVTSSPTGTPTLTRTPTPTNTPSPTPTRTPFTINLPIIREGY
jgi:hypothetical protein